VTFGRPRAAIARRGQMSRFATASSVAATHELGEGVGIGLSNNAPLIDRIDLASW